MINALLLSLACATVDLESLVDRLNAADWREREAATQAIAKATLDLPVEILDMRLAHDDLSLEQRARLLVAIERRIFVLPRAAMGVRMETQFGPEGPPPAGVLVASVTPGLPAEALLERGDVILRLNDTPLTTPRDLVGFVQARWPGERIEMEVLKVGANEPRGVTMELGSMASFPEAQRPTAPLATDVQRRAVERIRRTHAPVRRAISPPDTPGRGSAQWIVQEVARQQGALATSTHEQAHAVAAARWRTWLKAVQMRLGDRFISDDKRARLEAAQHKLQEALRSHDDAGVR